MIRLLTILVLSVITVNLPAETITCSVDPSGPLTSDQGEITITQTAIFYDLASIPCIYTFQLWDDNATMIAETPVYTNDLEVSRIITINPSESSTSYYEFVVIVKFYDPSIGMTCIDGWEEDEAVRIYIVEPPEECPTTLTTTDIPDISGGSPQVFLASNSITANNSISNAADVRYGATSSVKLTTGFEVASGCHFVADLNGCTQSKAAHSIKSEEPVYRLLDETNPVSVYPNPSNGIFTVNMSGTEGLKNIRIYNLSGQIVFEKNDTEEISSELNLQNLPKGYYFIQMDYSKGTYKEKLILK